ncbi:MAG: hypothetical protein ABSG68_05370 [Thermoguttaceae bacterium]|jgi:hypothetical protein
MSYWRNWRFLLAVAAALIPIALVAADRKAKSAPEARTVEMFAAIQRGDIAVKLIPKDSRSCRIIIENKTHQPLNIKLPETFAGVPAPLQIGDGRPGGDDDALPTPVVIQRQDEIPLSVKLPDGFVPVLAQPGGAARPAARNNNNNNQNQGVGGGMGGMGMGMGGGMMYVAPEKVGQFKVPTVCLDHGKGEPRPNIPYDIKPLESYTDKPAVYELCRLLGTGQIDQRAAQAAAWNLNNNMSWQQLAAKQLRFADGSRQPYFAAQEIQAAMQLAGVAVHNAHERQQQQPQSSSDSSQN